MNHLYCLLQVNAKSEEKTDTSYSSQVYMRQYQLPPGVNPNTLKPSLTQDGVLSIEAPAPALKQKEKLIPIDYKN